MARYKICNIIPLIFIAFIKIRICLPSISKIPLRPAVHKIDHGIFFLRIVKIVGGQKNTKVPHLSKHTTIMPRINNGYIVCILSVGAKGERYQKEEINN